MTKCKRNHGSKKGGSGGKCCRDKANTGCSCGRSGGRLGGRGKETSKDK